MKTRRQRWLPIIALGGLLMVPIAWSMGPGAQGHGDPEHMLSRLSEHLELSEQQRSQVRDILAQNGDQVRVDRERLQALRNALEEQRTDFDAGEAQRLADELGEITSRMAFGMTSKQAQIYAVLTDEQRAEFARLHAERDSRVHRRIGKHRE